MTKQHILLYSHGFGVKKDDRGLFTDIATAFPNSIHHMVDLGVVNEEEKTILVASLQDQVRTLKTEYANLCGTHPDAVIDVVAHSQGCVVAALANLQGVRKTVLLAPPPDLDVASRVEKYGERPGAFIDTQGMSRIPGSDGYTKLVPAGYWQSLCAPQPIHLYNSLSKRTDLLIVTALDDEIIDQLPVEGFDPSIRIEELSADHNFTGEARQELLTLLNQMI